MPKSRQGCNTSEPKPARLLNHGQRGADSVKLRKHCLTEFSSAHVYIQRQSCALRPGKQGYFSYPGSESWRVRGRSIQIKMPLHPQVRRKKTPIDLRKPAQSTVSISLSIQKILVAWGTDGWTDRREEQE